MIESAKLGSSFHLNMLLLCTVHGVSGQFTFSRCVVVISIGACESNPFASVSRMSALRPHYEAKLE